MSATASETPFPALCPWFSATSTDFGRMTRITVEHGGAARHFDVSHQELTQQFASVFNRALTVKHELIVAADVFKALNE